MTGAATASAESVQHGHGGKPSGDLSSRSRPPIGARYASGTVVEPPPSGLVELGVPAHVLT